MSDDLKKFTRLKKRVEGLQRELDRSEGVIENLENRLQSEFGVESVAEAKRRIKELQKEQGRLQTKFKKKIKAFEKELNQLNEKEE